MVFQSLIIREDFLSWWQRVNCSWYAGSHSLILPRVDTLVPELSTKKYQIIILPLNYNKFTFLILLVYVVKGV